MRLKQLLGHLVALLAFTAIAGAATSQLTSVSVANQGTTTTLTIRATGAFTHNEYRPEDKTVMVDLAGVSATDLKETQKTLNLSTVKSYRVVSYKGASGAEVTRVEVSLGDNVGLKVNEIRGGVELMLIGPTAVAAPKAQPAPAQSAETKPVERPKPQPHAIAAKAEQPAAAKPEVVAAKAEPASGTAVIRHIAVQRSKDGMIVEVQGAGMANAMKLANPDRIVLDFPGAISNLPSRTIRVNSADVKSIRVARFQPEPPVTRVVVDLTGPREFTITPGGTSLQLTLHAPAEKPAKNAVVPAPAETKKADATPAKSEAIRPAVTKTAQPVLAAASTPSAVPVPKNDNPDPLQPKAITSQPQKAQDYAFVEPTFTPKKAVAAEPVDRAGDAATTMARANSGGSNALPDPDLLAKPGPARNLVVVQQEQAAEAARKVAQPKYTGEPISVNLKDVDLKDFFRLIHEISGLNIVLDPGVKGVVTIVLDDVPWDQALDIVLQNNQLDRQLQGNVLRIASIDTIRKEADARRAQAEAQALAVDKQTVTRFLSYARAMNVVPTVKKFLTSRGDVTADERTNALIIQDIPAVLPEIDRLLAQLDRKTQEVEIEARVVAANRTFARDIGMQLGFGYGNGTIALGGAPQAGNSPLTVTQTDATGAKISPPYHTTPSGSIPLFSNPVGTTTGNSGLSFGAVGANYRLDAILVMAESRGLVKILSRPRVVTQNNVGATVRQGIQIPVVTQAQLGGPPTTSYVNAFLRLTVTPQITVENTIFLSVDVENTTPDFGNEVLGVPTLLTQQATTQVLVNDGGTIVIGGVIQTQNSVNTVQTPLLGDIPVLGNLFKRRSVSTQTQELIFFISPRIIQT